MAARAIVGILLGILFVPVLFLILLSIGDFNVFSNWIWQVTTNLQGFLYGWMTAGIQSTVAPLLGTNSLIEGFGTGTLLEGFLPLFAGSLVTWAVVGMWAGAIERSPGRGIGVGVGVWLAWLIIMLIGMYMIPEIALFLAGLFLSLGFLTVIDLLLAMLLPLIVVIVVAVIFGAMTKSEEF
jgi:hypothetical protein